MFFFLIIHTIEVSFLSAMPFYIYLAPLLYAVVVYMIQHLGIFKVAWWLPLHGLILDYHQIGTSRFQVIAYTMAALSIIYLARNVFTNRSFYGVITNGLLSFLVYVFIQLTILFIESIFERNVLWNSLINEILVSAGFLCITIILIYLVISWLRTLFIISQNNNKFKKLS